MEEDPEVDPEVGPKEALQLGRTMQTSMSRMRFQGYPGAISTQAMSRVMNPMITTI